MNISNYRMVTVREHTFFWTRFKMDGMLGMRRAAPCYSMPSFKITIFTPCSAAVAHPLLVSWTREVSRLLFLPLYQRSEQRVRTTMRHSGTPVACCTPLLTLSSDHRPRPGGRPMRFFTLLGGVTSRGSTNSSSFR